MHKIWHLLVSGVPVIALASQQPNLFSDPTLLLIDRTMLDLESPKERVELLSSLRISFYKLASQFIPEETRRRFQLRFCTQVLPLALSGIPDSYEAFGMALDDLIACLPAFLQGETVEREECKKVVILMLPHLFKIAQPDLIPKIGMVIENMVNSHSFEPQSINDCLKAIESHIPSIDNDTGYPNLLQCRAQWILAMSALAARCQEPLHDLTIRKISLTRQLVEFAFKWIDEGDYAYISDLLLKMMQNDPDVTQAVLSALPLSQASFCSSMAIARIVRCSAVNASQVIDLSITAVRSSIPPETDSVEYSFSWHAAPSGYSRCLHLLKDAASRLESAPIK